MPRTKLLSKCRSLDGAPGPGHRTPPPCTLNVLNLVKALEARIAELEYQVSSLKERPISSGHNRYQASPTFIEEDFVVNESLNPEVLQYGSSLCEDGAYDAGYPLLERSGSNVSSLNDHGQSESLSNAYLAPPINYALDASPNVGIDFYSFNQTSDLQGLNAEATAFEQSDPDINLVYMQSDLDLGLDFDFDRFLNTPSSPLAAVAQSASPVMTAPSMVSPTSARLTCRDCNRPFKRQGDLERHRRLHSPTARRLPCPFPGCARGGNNGFLRTDKLREHRRNRNH